MRIRRDQEVLDNSEGAGDARARTNKLLVIAAGVDLALVLGLLMWAHGPFPDRSPLVRLLGGLLCFVVSLLLRLIGCLLWFLFGSRVLFEWAAALGTVGAPWARSVLALGAFGGVALWWLGRLLAASRGSLARRRRMARVLLAAGGALLLFVLLREAGGLLPALGVRVARSDAVAVRFEPGMESAGYSEATGCPAGAVNSDGQRSETAGAVGEVERMGDGFTVVRLDYDRVEPVLVRAPGFDAALKCFPVADVESLVSDEDLVAAVPGPYFDPETGGSIGPMFSGGRLVRGSYEGMRAGSFVAFRPGGVGLLDINETLPGDVLTGFWCGPRLIEGGARLGDAESEGYRAPLLDARARRAALVTDGANHVYLAATEREETLEEWVDTLATHFDLYGLEVCVNLDGGDSAFLWERLSGEGRFHGKPERPLPYVLAFRRRG